MAAIAAILSGIARSSWRDLRSLGSIAGNNLIAVIVLMKAEEPSNRGSSTSFFLLLIGVLVLFPLSADVLRQVPAERFRLWPLSGAQRIAVRAGALALNPMLPIAVLFAAVAREMVVGIALIAASIIAQAVMSAAEGWSRGLPHLHPMRVVPRFPGRLGGLAQNQVRQLLGSLDVYFAAALAIGGAIYRFTSAHPDPAARLMMGLMTVLFLSTLAQCQFGFDSAAEEIRYRLLPLSGWGILLAKDAAWFAVALLLTWPFRLLPDVAACAVALAIGHDTAVREPIRQRRWRFAEGRLWPAGFFQIAGLISAGVAVDRYGWRIAPVFLGGYAVSLWWYARQWEEGRE